MTKRKIKRFLAMFGVLLVLACVCLPTFVGAFSITDLTEYNYLDVSQLLPTPEVNNQGKKLAHIVSTNVDTGEIVIETDIGYIGSGYVPAQFSKTLYELCPEMEVGNTYFLNSSNTANDNAYIYLSGIGYWQFNQARTITEEDLNAKVQFYGLPADVEQTKSVEYHLNLWITKGETPCYFVPYGMKQYFDAYYEEAYKEAYDRVLEDLTPNIFKDSSISVFLLWEEYNTNAGWSQDSTYISSDMFDYVLEDSHIDLNPSDGSSGARDLPYLITDKISTVQQYNQARYFTKELIVKLDKAYDLCKYQFWIEKYVYTAFQHPLVVTAVSDTGQEMEFTFTLVDRCDFILTTPEGFMTKELRFKITDDLWDFSGTSISCGNAVKEYYDKGFYDGQADARKDFNSIRKEAYNEGYNKGSTVGYNNGFEKGYADGATGSSWFNFFSAVVSAPVNAFTSLFNFDIFGVNMAGFVASLVTICVVIAVVRFVI